MHITCLTDVHNVLILNESAKDFKEGSQVEEFRRNIKFFISSGGLVIVIKVFFKPFFPILEYLLRKSVLQFLFFCEIDNFIITGDLILWYDFHHHVLVNIIALIVEDYCNPQKIKQFALLVPIYLQIVGIFDHQLDHCLYVFVLHQFLIVCIHLFIKIYATNVLFEMGLGHLQNKL